MAYFFPFEFFFTYDDTRGAEVLGVIYKNLFAEITYRTIPFYKVGEDSLAMILS